MIPQGPALQALRRKRAAGNPLPRSWKDMRSTGAVNSLLRKGKNARRSSED